jgi:hypothetical protein
LDGKRKYVSGFVYVARRRRAVAMQRGRFLLGPFWGCCLATTSSIHGCCFAAEGVFFGIRYGAVAWQQPEARPERTETTEQRERNRTRTAEYRGVAKFGESEIATVDTHLVLWSTRATPGISASVL